MPSRDLRRLLRDLREADARRRDSDDGSAQQRAAEKEVEGLMREIRERPPLAPRPDRSRSGRHRTQGRR